MAGVHGEEVSPHALLDLILYLVREWGVGVDVVLAEGLCVLGRRAEGKCLRIVVVAVCYLTGTALGGCSGRLLDGAELCVIASVTGIVGDGRRQLLPGGDGGSMAVVDTLRRQALGAAGFLERLLFCVVGRAL